MQVGLLQIVTNLNNCQVYKLDIYMLVEHRDIWKIYQGQEIGLEKKKKASVIPREVLIIALTGYMYVTAKANASRESNLRTR